MKVTLKQKKKIIKKAKAVLWVHKYLCLALNESIESELNIYCACEPKQIREIFPRFKWRNAVRYFKGNPDASEDMSWWRKEDAKYRVKFLDFLLTGKRPKKS